MPLQLPINILQDATFPHEPQQSPSSPLVRQVPTQLPVSIPQRSRLSVQSQCSVLSAQFIQSDNAGS
ncbi:hypothetical protein CesoFtcFv8_000899 [Champsocephalus esox]|uniref:Uncharacterized protein n=1 Tax=Champsocephalus esox TaxID=159716 RepID=A0AAN8D2F0_9TELE|nr:hypothetical protein CesoFtcFv8_000899 [Champsocephalus esox]